ncbi:predicted protein [Uncinocarpus reesii 1704]|uniref:Uncharacterized protein n=1 Tax=Uncinocarpus reesii (strain UAMH 1704) TaxID=336963 RepID=C4JHM1_UNCRE|nr:uncharacterized protein UREG_02707 [Uncinocarpus reesii 1704]EEP77858.1 predicted protein [Uncinocarpus reesii 1704]
MPPLETSHLSLKRQQPEHPSVRHLKRQQLDRSASAYWDKLSTIYLTKGALREHDRRNSALKQLRKPHKPVNHQHCRPNTRQFEQDARLELVRLPGFLCDCSPTQLKEITRFSRLGGPDLSDLKNYPVPMSSRMPSSHYSTESPPSSTSRYTKTKTSSTSPYSWNFQQNLIDHGVYPDGYEYPDGRIPSAPNNIEEILEQLAQRRPSLSPSKFSNEDFRKFKHVDTHASKQKPVTTSVVPILDGNISDLKCVGGGYLFGNLAPLTDGTLASAKPDHFYDLSHDIIPSTQNDLPMAPNFFLEAKGPDRSLAVATQQACYDGALGTCGMHALQSYLLDKPTYDNNAYTIASTYQGGQLKLYASHICKPDNPDSHPEYIMTQLRTFACTDSSEAFRQGASAYRNARDWAKGKRDEFIRAANERFHNANSQSMSTPQHQTSVTPILDDSNNSTKPAGYQDAAQWSFAVEEEVPQGNPKG